MQSHLFPRYTLVVRWNVRLFIPSSVEGQQPLRVVTKCVREHSKEHRIKHKCKQPNYVARRGSSVTKCHFCVRIAYVSYPTSCLYASGPQSRSQCRSFRHHSLRHQKLLSSWTS